ncbi:hypothetical protein [Desulfobotulus sp.]|jgi:hypothetical protein|nr:hypothetical protein [Desulfobotulus sp.]MDY0163042.1 hypothetical protein [Desulfobotulus sp.]
MKLKFKAQPYQTNAGEAGGEESIQDTFNAGSGPRHTSSFP